MSWRGYLEGTAVAALLLVAAVATVGSIWLSYRPLVKLQRAEGRHLEKMGGIPRAPSLSSLRARVQRLPDSDLRSAIGAVLDAEDAAEAVYAVTEISLLAQAEVRRVGYLPKVAGRIALATGSLVALVVLSQSIPTGSPAIREAGIAFGIGLLGAVICTFLARRLEQLLERRRELWTRLLDALGHLAEGTHLPTVELDGKNPSVDLQPEPD